MQEPMNEAAYLVKSAQSNVTDLTSQITELLAAKSKQQAVIDSLLPVAVWGLTESGSVDGEVANIP